MKKKTLEYFFPLLAHKVEVQAALEDHFGDHYTVILEKLKSGSQLNDDELEVHNIIYDLVDNEYEIVNSSDGNGYAGKFPIDICRYGPVYYISAPEFDRIGYFTTMAEAIEEADHEFSSFYQGDDEDDDESE